jgi:hypothetical protein
VTSVVSPVGISLLSIGVTPGEALCFTATGQVTHGSEISQAPLTGPQGYTSADADGFFWTGRNDPGITPSLVGTLDGSENGISDIYVPMDSLIGVFTDGGVPSTEGAAPAPLYYDSGAEQGSPVTWGTDVGTLNFADQAPQLRQPFYIGDGSEDSTLFSGANGNMRMFTVPAGATELYFGMMSVYDWTGDWNPGPPPTDPGFTVDVSLCPEPGSLSLLGLGAVGLLFRRRRA